MKTNKNICVDCVEHLDREFLNESTESSSIIRFRKCLLDIGQILSRPVLKCSKFKNRKI